MTTYNYNLHTIVPVRTRVECYSDDLNRQIQVELDGTILARMPVHTEQVLRAGEALELDRPSPQRPGHYYFRIEHVSRRSGKPGKIRARCLTHFRIVQDRLTEYRTARYHVLSILEKTRNHMKQMEEDGWHVTFTPGEMASLDETGEIENRRMKRKDINQVIRKLEKPRYRLPTIEPLGETEPPDRTEAPQQIRKRPTKTYVPGTKAQRRTRPGTPWPQPHQQMLTYVAYTTNAYNIGFRELARSRRLQDEQPEDVFDRLLKKVGEDHVNGVQICTLDTWRELLEEDEERTRNWENRYADKEDAADLVVDLNLEKQQVEKKRLEDLRRIPDNVRRNAARARYEALKRAYNSGMSLWWLGEDSKLRKQLEAFKPRRVIGHVFTDFGKTRVAHDKKKWRPLQGPANKAFDLDRCFRLIEDAHDPAWDHQ